jgi:hypothetical protein
MTVQSAAQTDRAGPQYRARAHPGAAVVRWAGATHVDDVRADNLVHVMRPGDTR